MPKYHLSTPPKHSLQAWWMVIDGLDANEVSFLFLFYFFFVFFLCLGMTFFFFFLGSL